MANKKKSPVKYGVRRVVLLVVILALVGAGGWYAGQSGLLGGESRKPKPADFVGASDPPEELSQEPEPNSEPEPSSVSEPEPEPEKPAATDDDSWQLILVNSTHALPENFSVELAKLDDSYKVDARIANAALQMFKDAKLSGITIFPCSAYRPVDYQEGLFNSKVEEYIGEGKTEEEALAVAATIIAAPGTSEHHTGLAMDIVTTDYQILDEGFAETDAFIWLSQNAHKYGFILRYPKDKQDITEIIYEPWHYRYVGVEHAAIIRENNICLEEYIDMLAAVEEEARIAASEAAASEEQP